MNYKKTIKKTFLYIAKKTDKRTEEEITIARSPSAAASTIFLKMSALQRESRVAEIESSVRHKAHSCQGRVTRKTQRMFSV